jgi:hypothetical protein
MGTNWNSGLLCWKDLTPSATERYSLSHLHPFVRQIELAETNRHAARIVDLHVSFGLHTFTRATEAHDGSHELYQDNREVRTFCRDRDPLPRFAGPCAARYQAATPAIAPQKRETPHMAGFRQSGSAYLPPGQTSCEAGMHLAGFCAQTELKRPLLGLQDSIRRFEQCRRDVEIGT